MVGSPPDQEQPRDKQNYKNQCVKMHVTVEDKSVRDSLAFTLFNIFHNPFKKLFYLSELLDFIIDLSYLFFKKG